LAAVLEHGQDWKKIADEVGIRSSKDALIEFARIKTPELYGSDQYLELHAKTLDKTNKVPRAQKPFSSLDQFFLQCQMLQQFADEKPDWLEPRPKDSRINKKLA
jgi:hypothetical protein